MQKLIEHSNDTTFENRYYKIRQDRAKLDELYQLSPDEYEEYDLLRKNKDENDALILQLKSNNQAKEVEKQELEKILKNLNGKK